VGLADGTAVNASTVAASAAAYISRVLIIQRFLLRAFSIDAEQKA
jgi:hypothetical protein